MREVWFNYSTTIGLRENRVNRWILPRRIGKHITKFGEITFKLVMRPNGKISIKLEHNDLSQISLRTGITSLFGLSNLYLLKQATDYFAQSTELSELLSTIS